MAFVADQRPLVFCSPFGALYGDNLFGLDPLWRTTPHTTITQMRTLAGECGGINRLMLSMPQGSLAAPSNYPASNSGILEAPVLAYFSGVFAPQAGEEWSLYSGRLIPHNGLQTSGVTAPSNRFATTDADALFIATAVQLYGNAGFVEMGLDASSDAPTFTDTTLPNRVAWARKIIAEALPIIDSGPGPGAGGRLWTIDNTLIRQRAYLALDAAFLQSFDPTDTWNIPQGCEVHAVVYNADLTRLNSLRSRGFIVSPQSGCTGTVKTFVRDTYYRVPRGRLWSLVGGGQA